MESGQVGGSDIFEDQQRPTVRNQNFQSAEVTNIEGPTGGLVFVQNQHAINQSAEDINHNLYLPNIDLQYSDIEKMQHLPVMPKSSHKSLFKYHSNVLNRTKALNERRKQAEEESHLLATSSSPMSQGGKQKQIKGEEKSSSNEGTRKDKPKHKISEINVPELNLNNSYLSTKSGNQPTSSNKRDRNTSIQSSILERSKG